MSSIREFLTVLIALFVITPSAFADALETAIEIAASGAKVQMERLTAAAENIANEDSTGSTPGEQPYRRKVVYVHNKYDPRLKTNIVQVKKYGYDKAPFLKRYDPNHPAADAEGYVLYPNVHKEIEKADTIEAKNSHEANLSIIEISKAMMQKT